MVRKRARLGYKKQPIPLEWGARSGADFAALRERRDAVSGAEGQRFDGHGGLSTAGSHQAAAIAKEKIFDVMRAVVRIDHRCLRIVSHAAGAEEMYAELLFLSRKTPFFLSARRVVELVGPRIQPIGKLQIIRMVLVGQAESGQAPGILQFGIQRKAVVLEWQRSAMARDLHGASEIVRQGGLEILAPAWRSRRESAKGKADGSEIEASIESTTAVEAEFLRIQLVEVVQHAADVVALVIVQGVLEQTDNEPVAVEHDVFADQAAGIGEAVGELRVGRKQKQARGFGAVGANYHCLSLLQMRVALLIEVHCADRAPIGVRLDAMHVRIGTNFAAPRALRHSNGGG